MANNWTDSQRHAITVNGGPVIVTAAAGAGKTTVLVERVLSRITDKSAPIDIDRILIVTYTKAAAQELKDRFAKRLGEMIADDPFDKNLVRQQMLLSRAHISTIDSFCNSIVKEFFYLLNVDRNIRVAEAGELEIIKNEALRYTLDDMYLKSEPDFLYLADSYKGTKDDVTLQKNILKIYEYLRSHPFMDKWIKSTEDLFSDIDDIESSAWGKIVYSYALDAADFLISLCNSSLDCISNDEKLNEKCKFLFADDLELAIKLKDKLENGSWTDVHRLLSKITFAQFPRITGYKENPYKLKAAANRNLFKETIKKLIDIFSYDADTCKRDIADLCVLTQQMLACVRNFSNNYQMLKANKKVADYADLEHWTLQLLVNEKDDTYTEIAQQIASRFDEILIDEYQDANEVQEYIFKSISRDGNLFFVGDVKQSIYGFRQAMPQLFLNRKNESFLYDESAPKFPAKIILDKNFRSISGVTSAVNYFFEKLMSPSVGDIIYDESESLVCGAKYNDEPKPSVTAAFIDLGMSGEVDACVAEAKYIGETILKMIGDAYPIREKEGVYHPASFFDFAVLMRNKKKYAPIYAEVLNQMGVKASCETTKSFFELQEIQVMICLLGVIDNPCLDIELLTVMMSPLFGFTPDDLAVIRSESRNTSLYASVRKSAEAGDEKCKHLLAELSYYRDVCVTMTVSQLIGCIYERSSYPNIVSSLSDSDIAVNNLRLLREYASNYERSKNAGLSRFVSYIHRLIENESDLDAAVDLNSAANNSVSVMSIHKSKGLEYSVCFVVNQSRSFNSDKAQSVSIHSKYGLGIKRLDKKNNVRYNTMPRKALSLEIERDEKSEELRILYVAMTRAKQKLFLVSSHKDVFKYLRDISSCLTNGKTIPPFVVRNAKHISDWIAMCALMHPDCGVLRDWCDADVECDREAQFPMSAEIVTELADITSDSIGDVKLTDIEPDYTLVDLLKQRMAFEYKNEPLLKLPSKVAASELSHKLSDNGFDRMLDTPAFMSDKKLTPAQRGTALHAFMQYCDFNKARDNLENELSHLCENGYLSDIQADSIDKEKALAFINSDIISRCLKSDRVFKEYRFTIKVDASLVDSSIDEKFSNEKILLQGAVDLAFVENNKLVIVDYKTDNVKCLDDLYGMYQSQLKIYADAMQQCTDYTVAECLIYSVKHNKSLKVNF